MLKQNEQQTRRMEMLATILEDGTLDVTNHSWKVFGMGEKGIILEDEANEQFATIQIVFKKAEYCPFEDLETYERKVLAQEERQAKKKSKIKSVTPKTEIVEDEITE